MKDISQKKALQSQAATKFSEALKEQPKDPSAHINRGAIYFELGLLDQAVTDFSEALRVSPNSVDAFSQSVRVSHLRRSRYIGVAKTHLQHLLTATAINLLRVGAWLVDTQLA